MNGILLISLVTPTFNNLRAASALPYHLIRGMGGNARFEIYSFNINNLNKEEIAVVEKELNIVIHILRRPFWMDRMFKYHLGWFRLFFRFPYLAYCDLSLSTIDEIRNKRKDTVWIYGEEITGLAKYFKGMKVIATMPDCTSLYYHRLLGKPFVSKRFIDIIRCSAIYAKYLRFERDSWKKLKANGINIKYHFVGQADADFFKEQNPDSNAFFLRHPLYAYNPRKEYRFRSPIRILIAGRYDVYMKYEADLLIKELKNSKNEELKKNYFYTFLGKGWEKHVETLKTTGYHVEHIVYALDYIHELHKYDLQITPISVGTGTKGKVLDAVANGLLEIGTQGALENIALVNGISCIIYSRPEQVITVLEDMMRNVQQYEEMAKRGYEEIIAHHDPVKVAHLLFS